MTVGVLGLGLIGGSLARAIQANTAHTVLGADLIRSVIYRAKLMEVIHDELTEERVGECDIIILALYPKDTVEWVKSHASVIKKDAVVVDSSDMTFEETVQAVIDIVEARNV